jgi:hypothetical protein
VGSIVAGPALLISLSRWSFRSSDQKAGIRLEALLDNECFVPFAHEHREARQIGVLSKILARGRRLAACNIAVGEGESNVCREISTGLVRQSRRVRSGSICRFVYAIIAAQYENNNNLNMLAAVHSYSDRHWETTGKAV